MQNILAKFTLDSCWVAIVTIGGDAVGDNSGHRSRLPEERFGGGKVSMLAQHYVNQRTISIDSSIQVAPLAMDFDVCLIDIPCVDGPLGSRG